MKREIFTLVGLVILYLIVTFFLDNSVIWLQVPIHLILASVVAFLIFKKDLKPIKKGLVFSLIILAVMNIVSYLLGLLTIVDLTDPTIPPATIGVLNVISTIQNPITYALIFLVSFNIPFIIKRFILKKQNESITPPFS